MVTYIDRLADTQLTDALSRAGAVLIEGPKACGKTATASRQASSVIRVDTDPAVEAQILVDPALTLEGARPRLVDEWQVYPQLWNAVRRAVDDASERGQFILTGSTAPGTDAIRHSGAGRFARLRMRTMSLFESGDSNASVSLSALLDGYAPRSALSHLDLQGLLARITRGGWPGLSDLTNSAAATSIRDYAATIATVDIGSAGKIRDPSRVTRLMRGLARATATETTISTLARDETTLSRDAVREYLDALSRIFIIEDQPAWSAHLRSSATLRQEPKRHFADPSIAVALVGASPTSLLRDLNYTGQLFESLVVHELRVLSQPLEGEVFHARDSLGREVDAIVQLPSGYWAAFEVKLGTNAKMLDAAAANLHRFAHNVESSQEPILTVVTGTGPSYRRTDGVNVVSVSALAP